MFLSPLYTLFEARHGTHLSFLLILCLWGTHDWELIIAGLNKLIKKWYYFSLKWSPLWTVFFLPEHQSDDQSRLCNVSFLTSFCFQFLVKYILNNLLLWQNVGKVCRTVVETSLPLVSLTDTRHTPTVSGGFLSLLEKRYSICGCISSIRAWSAWLLT